MSHVVVLSGGVGGAKLALGMSRVVSGDALTVVVNTGDDFRHLGLAVSPDVDTVLYALSGRADAERGWGRADETWSFMAALRELGGEDWFQLGDRDLALHVLRTHSLAAGERLAAITRRVAAAWGIGARIVPMSDDPVATMVDSAEGPLAFQRYFVERRCAPAVRAIRFAGADRAAPAPDALAAIAAAEAIVIAPSNPFLSIEPILAVPGLRAALAAAGAPVVAVSPLIGGDAVKGPTAKIMAELGLALANESIAARYAGLIDGLLIDRGDRCEAAVAIAATDTMMRTVGDKERVAAAALDLARQLR